MVTYDKIQEIRTALWNSIYEHYISTELFSAGWLFLIALTVVSYIVWIKVCDKSRLKELLLVGSFVTVCMAFFDVVATTMLLWGHKVRVFPGVPSLFATDYTLFPIIIMIAQQFAKSGRDFLLWVGLGSAILAFVIFPVYALLGTMALNRLNYFYIFLIVYTVSLISRGAFIWVTGIEQRHKN
jgi:hypothetical protein